MFLCAFLAYEKKDLRFVGGLGVVVIEELKISLSSYA
jgi:hypothetical protein